MTRLSHRYALRLALALLVAGACVAGVRASSGGGFTLDWFTFDNGGGTSSGGSYTLSGTLGQPDAGAASAGSYALAGGFWPGAAPEQRYTIRLPMVKR